MMKDDITQPEAAKQLAAEGCGLMMKDDITQRCSATCPHEHRCGLMMKDDITQRAGRHAGRRRELWFDDERRYYTTVKPVEQPLAGCGLMMKDDITQPKVDSVFPSKVVV